jgi:hypothetical protein
MPCLPTIRKYIYIKGNFQQRYKVQEFQKGKKREISQFVHVPNCYDLKNMGTGHELTFFIQPQERKKKKYLNLSMSPTFSLLCLEKICTLAMNLNIQSPRNSSRSYALCNQKMVERKEKTIQEEGKRWDKERGSGRRGEIHWLNNTKEGSPKFLRYQTP